MKKLVLFLILLLAGQVNAVGYGSSIEGDSAGVTLTLNTARDSAWIRFASPHDNFYDSVKAVPISGSSNKILIAPYLDLDTLGGHIVVAYAFTGDIRVDTIPGEWYHRAAHVGINWADIINPASSQPTINVQLWKGVTPADLESDFTVQAHVTDMSDDVIGSGELAASAVNKIAAYPSFVVKGVVDAGTFSTTSFTSADLTQGNDFWNRNAIYMFSGSLAGQSSVVEDFIASTDSIYFQPGLTAAPVAGDSFKISFIPQVYIAGNNGFVTAEMTSTGIDLIWNEDTTGHGTAQSFGFMLKDTLAYQGSAVATLPDSLLEMIAVVDSIKWKVDTLQIYVGKDGQSTALVSLHMKTGPYSGAAGDNIEDNLDSLQLHLGKDGQSTPRVSVHMKLGSYSGAAGDNNNVKDDIAALTLTGGGTEPETLIVLDTADTTQVSGARITVRTIDQSTVKVDGLITDVNGKLILDLDSDSFFVATISNNYQQALDTIVVAVGGQTDTIWVTPMNPAAPTGPNMVNAYIYTWDLVGDTVVNARLEITLGKTLIPPFRDADSNLVAIPRKIVAYSDTLGLVQKSIWKSSKVTDIRGNPVTYNFKITKSNYFSALFENRTAPDSSTWKIK